MPSKGHRFIWLEHVLRYVWFALSVALFILNTEQQYTYTEIVGRMTLA